MTTFTVTRINSMTGKKVVKTVECNHAYEAAQKVVSNYLMANAWHVESCLDVNGKECYLNLRSK